MKHLENVSKDRGFLNFEKNFRIRQNLIGNNSDLKMLQSIKQGIFVESEARSRNMMLRKKAG